MSSGIRNTLVSIAAFIAVVLGLYFYTFFESRNHLDKEQFRELGYIQFDEPRPIAPFELVNQRGEPVDLTDLQGQWSLLFFGFTYCPDVCPTTMGVLSRAMDRLAQDPQVVLVSVDPERDTPEQLSNYLPSFDPAFQGYTGSHDAITKFATGLNVAFGKVPGPAPGTYTVDHSASIVVVDPAGRYAGFIKAPHSAMHIKQIMQALM